MSSASFDSAGQVRTALDAIVSDPAHGPGALGRPEVMANLLSDYLPELPRESGLLLAAARADLAGTLRAYVDQGMDPDMAARLAAASLAERTAFTAGACEWVTAQIAHAIGVAMAAQIGTSDAADLEQLSEPHTQTSTPPLFRYPAAEQGTGGGQDRVPPRRRRGIRRRDLVTALTVVVVVVAAALFALTRREHAGLAAPKVPAPRLAQFVPPTQRVLRIDRVHLDSGQVPETAVITTASSPSSASSYAAEDMLLLAWDHYAHRWTLIYNAARDNVDVAYEPDAFTDSFEANYLPAPTPLIPKGLGVASIHLAEIRDQPHGAADLLVTATVLFADGFGQEIGIIHYDGNVAKVTWAFLARGGGVTVIGPQRHQQVAVTSLWTTASDPQCCPARSYRFVLARASEPQVGEYYQVIADNRPWIGAIITEQPPQSANSQAAVVSVVPGSPAAGLVRPGDILTAINGSPAPSHGLGPAIFDQLAAYQPGQTISLDILRHGHPLTVRIKLGSLADHKAVNAGTTLSSSNGNRAQYML